MEGRVRVMSQRYSCQRYMSIGPREEVDESQGIKLGSISLKP